MGTTHGSPQAAERSLGGLVFSGAKMTKSSRDDGLQITEDLDFQHRIWKLQRIGWAVMVLLILAAVLGLFGRGILSRAVVTDAQGQLSVEYSRFARFQAPVELVVRIQHAADEAPSFWISREYWKLSKWRQWYRNPSAWRPPPTD
jgi:hypothetical protein